MSDTLYEIQMQFADIEAVFAEHEDEQAFLDTLESIDWEDRFYDKMDACVMKIRQKEMAVEAKKAQRDYLKKLCEEKSADIKADENQIRKIKEKMMAAMDVTHHQKFETSNFKYWSQRTTPTLVIDKKEDVPLDFYTKPEPEIDNKAIRKALEDGEKLGFAHLEEKSVVRFK